jgi:hypothetical protein
MEVMGQSILVYIQPELVNASQSGVTVTLLIKCQLAAQKLFMILYFDILNQLQ